MTLEEYLISDELKKRINDLNKPVEEAVFKNSLGIQVMIPSLGIIQADADRKLAAVHAVRPVSKTTFAFFKPATEQPEVENKEIPVPKKK